MDKKMNQKMSWCPKDFKPIEMQFIELYLKNDGDFPFQNDKNEKILRDIWRNLNKMLKKKLEEECSVESLLNELESTKNTMEGLKKEIMEIQKTHEKDEEKLKKMKYMLDKWTKNQLSAVLFCILNEDNECKDKAKTIYIL